MHGENQSFILKNKTFAFHTLGCKVNEYETEAMEELLTCAGAVSVPFSSGADFYVINTCSVTNIADRKSRQMLHRARKLNPEAVIIAAGCYSQIQADGQEQTQEILVRVGADLIVPNGEEHRIVEIISEYLQEGKRIFVHEIGKEKKTAPLFISRTTERSRAFVKVQDGCNQFCSYCIIPYARGRIRSREVQDILDEVRALSESGTKEIVLTGIHLSSYGKEKREEGEPALPDLSGLIGTVSRIPGIERIRLGSLEPRIVTEDFAAVLSKNPKVCPHFHLSLQSGSDATLKRMNRHYTTAEYEEGCRLLRKYFDDPAITTDVIVGFPGESEEDFEDSLRFTEQTGFYELHVFKYSRRKGTAADRMDSQIEESCKTKRSAVLLKQADEMSVIYRKRQIGREKELLTETEEEINGQRYLTGYTREYVRCAIPKAVCEEAGIGFNQVVKGTPTAFLTDEILLFSAGR